MPENWPKWRTTPRLVGFDYHGEFAYHLTFVTHARLPVLTGSTARAAVVALSQAAASTNFEILAYVAMPNHLHALVQSASEDADCVRLAQRFKQRTGYDYKQRTGDYLWQPSFHDHVIRAEEDLLATARYIVQNPVRARLTDEAEAWPFTGGSVILAERPRS